MAILSLEWYFLALLLIPILFNFWTIVLAYKNDALEPHIKMAWIGFCIFVPVIGAIIYWIKNIVLKK